MSIENIHRHQLANRLFLSHLRAYKSTEVLVLEFHELQCSIKYTLV